MEGGQKGPPTSFSLAIATNVGFGPQNFQTFSLKPFYHTSAKFQVCT